MLHPRHLCAAWPALAALMCSLGAFRADAALVAYELNPSLSSLSVSGTAANGVAPIEEQSPGSLTMHFGGSLVLDLVGDAFTFGGQSSFDALPHPSAPFTPADPGEDNFGAHVDAFISQADVAGRDVAFTILSGASSFGGSANGLVFDYTAGHLAYRLTYTFGGGPQSGVVSLLDSEPATNAPNASIVRTADAQSETVAIPIDLTVGLSVVLPPPPDTILRFQGQIVATRSLAAPPDADFDADGDVDGADLLAWQRGLGLVGSAAHEQGNADHDSDVDADDLAVWRGAVGLVQASAQASAAVPEPSPLAAVGFLLLAATSPLGRRRSR